MKPYTFTGRVHRVYPVQTFSSGFKKRLVVLEEPDAKYPTFVAFEFLKDKADSVGNLRQGEPVSVEFYPEAHENPKKEGQWFSSNKAVKLEKMVGSANGDEVELVKAKAPEPEAEPEPTIDDMPF